MSSSDFFDLIDRRTLLAFGGLAAAAAIVGPARAAELYGPKADGAKSGGTLNMGLLVEPPGLDPFHQAADARIRLTVLIYQGLFYESPDGQPMPLLAEGFDLSSDRLVYTVRLRKGVKFHTGQPMTAKDVAYSYNYIRDPKNGSPGAGDFAMITSVEATDDATVKITISAPNAALPMTLGNKYGGVVPAGYFDAADAKTKLNQASVGTGPFKLTEFKPNSNVTLARNGDYWEPGVPYLDKINFVFVPNAASLLVGLRNKRIDIATLTRPQDVKQVEGVAGLVIERKPSFNQKAIDLGAELKPLDDERVRRAIALAVDKDEIMRASIGGLGKVIGTMVAGMQESWGVPLDKLPNQKLDIAAARKLLEEAGHPNGFDLTLTSIIGYDWMDAAAVTLREQLAKIGIRLAIQRVELGVWVKNFQSKQMGFTFNDWATVPDPNLLFYRHFHKAPEGADFRNWKNEAASALLDEGRVENDPAKRREIYARYQQAMAQSVPTIMLFSADHIVVRSEKVRNYDQHPTGWYYGLARTWLA
ncbi:ABC transporter substrate-binding protein [Bosea sp. (in: a-proteobacteria)]|jgi:peptide/nickel transport system substrate-binding protein|uniref:ABC transporter substrate-binding protein n=1 Tax=Bosea sp. (in: a-proteobacteria) TaxID=1871050 RepID=UPI003F72BC43